MLCGVQSPPCFRAPNYRGCYASEFILAPRLCCAGRWQCAHPRTFQVAWIAAVQNPNTGTRCSTLLVPLLHA